MVRLARSAVEDMRVDPRELGLPAGPTGTHISRVEIERVARLAVPQVLVRDPRDRLGAAPLLRTFVRLRDAPVAHERELLALRHHRAIVARVEARRRAVDDHARDRELAGQRLAARLEVDGLREALDGGRKV